MTTRSPAPITLSDLDRWKRDGMPIDAIPILIASYEVLLAALDAENAQRAVELHNESLTTFALASVGVERDLYRARLVDVLGCIRNGLPPGGRMDSDDQLSLADDIEQTLARYPKS